MTISSHFISLSKRASSALRSTPSSSYVRVPSRGISPYGAIWQDRPRLNATSWCNSPINYISRPPARYFANWKTGDDGDEDWIPPDDSPLHRNAINQSNNFLAEHLSPTDIDEDEIDVIDLEATLNNPYNQKFLQQVSIDDDNTSLSSLHASEFEMESSSVNNWGDILKELQVSGEDEMMQRLVKEYGLQDQLSELERNNFSRDGSYDASDALTSDGEDDDEEWDEDFEQSLQNLSEDDLINELIENSPSLSQLEMEIISQELNGTGLDDGDLNENNIAVKEFRQMVLDDYYAKKREREERKKESTSSTTRGASNASSEYNTAYPPEWTDYDSKAAFQRDFLEGNDSWIPPSLDFIPSRGQIDVATKSQASSINTTKDTTGFDGAVDWLQARRTRLGDDVPLDISDGVNMIDNEQHKKRPTHLLTPDQAETFRHQNSQISVVPYTLFTASELSTSLSAQGGSDIHIIDVSDHGDVYGVGIGCDTMMIVTGRNSSHIRVLADSIVRNLKARNLNERGVVGAVQGVEGGQDIFSNKRSRNRANRNGVNLSAKIDDDWMVVDCGNIHVHILEDTTRQCLNLEGLWDLSDPNSEGSKLRRINFDNEDEVDTYVAENPVPDEYSNRMMYGGDRGNWMTGGIGGRVQTVPIFTRKSFSEKWRGGGGGTKGKNRRR